MKEAFFALCNSPQAPRASYVSLYAIKSYYGGPEEGGWWGRDTELIAYHRVNTDEEAEALREKIDKLAHEMSVEAKDDFNRGCAAECAWLEGRGLDSDFLPEVDGEIQYTVYTETRPGEHNSEGSRRYE